MKYQNAHSQIKIAGLIISAISTFSPRDLRFQGPLSSPVGKEHLPYQTPDRNNHIRYTLINEQSCFHLLVVQYLSIEGIGFHTPVEVSNNEVISLEA